MLARAQTVEQLRQAQSVVLPLDYGLSLEQTARAIGRSVPWTCRLRNRFLAGEIVGDGQRQSRGGRRRQNMTAEQERELLAPFLERASTGGILVAGQVKAAIEARLGRSVALSTVYNLLHRTLAQARPGQAPPANRPGRAAGVEKKPPRGLAQFTALGVATGGSS